MTGLLSLGLLGSPEVLKPILLSLRVLLLVVPLLILAGIPLGIYLGRTEGPTATVVDFFVSLPLIFPPIATGFLLLVVLGRQSAFGILLHRLFGVRMVFSFVGVALAGFISGLPLLVKTVQATVRNELQGYIETACMLGKSRRIVFFRVIVPLLKRGIVTGLFLAVARSLGDVGVTLMLGGNIIGRTNTIALEVYNSVFLGDFQRAFLLAGLLGIVSLGITRFARAYSWE